MKASCFLINAQQHELCDSRPRCKRYQYIIHSWSLLFSEHFYITPAFGKAIQCLSKIGEELYIEAQKEGVRFT